MLGLNLAYFIIACAFLAISSIALVKLLRKIAILLHITDFAAAFIIMGAATSLPELFVGITSAIAKKPSLSFGNILGANLLDTTLVLGLIIIAARKIKVKEKGIGRDSIAMLFMAMLPIILFFIGNSISRLDGAILLLSYIAYAYIIAKTRKRKKNKSERKELGKAIPSIILFIACLIALFISANAVVKYSSAIADDFNIPLIVIGIFLISFGTTLPELSFGISSALLKHGEMGLGDQIGTVIFNSTFIVGITALIYPISAAFAPFIVASSFLLVSSLVTVVIMRDGKNLGIKEGLFLVLIYILFAILSFT